MKKKVLVLAEVRDGKLRNVTLEAVSAAKSIAEDGEVIVAVLGSQTQHVEKLASHGANTVYTINNVELDQYTTTTYVQAFSQLVEAVKPDVIFLGHTAIGKDLAPRIAAKLKIGLISDITALHVEEQEIIFTRPIYAGKAFQQKKSLDAVVMATIRPNNVTVNGGNYLETAQVIPFEVEVTDIRSIVKEVLKKVTHGVDLTEAKVIVSGGRGVKDASGFEPIQELADVLGAAVGASRGACDANFCDYSMQIGQTGKVVTPDLYIACGISGAIQHLAGMSNSKVIVAINKDPDAPIFKVANYGIVGDLFEVVPALTKEFKLLLEEVTI